MNEASRILINRVLRNRFAMLAQPEPTKEQIRDFEKEVQRNKEARERLRALSEVGWEELDNDSVEWLQEQLGIKSNT
ncbi:hypothetical protein JF535_04855 [Microbulbifer salipaludis]|uniref:Uncharacterized protein n=1 Tax=Microbulbifer salipaludis TaxID=187980 RepID=A0ABS3E4G2_9GAMM|nr:hypothetical protein [Microbulbifer salipaludis]MBN8430180.1 hypothetical protein [Microbulbifer salipaludis]